MPRVFGMASMLALVSCGWSGASRAADPVPNDGKDDVAAIQAIIDAKAENGGGVVTLAAGTFDLSYPLYLRSGVTLEGSPGGTLLTNAKLNGKTKWGGTTVFAGNLTPAIYQEADIGYPGFPVHQSGPVSVRLEDCARRPRAGTIVWISTVAGFEGKGGNFRPRHGEVSLVDSVDGCTVSVRDKLGFSDKDSLLLHWSDGSQAWPKIVGAQPNSPIKNAGLRNISIESKNGQALVQSGCYNCKFLNIKIVRSRRFLTVAGARHVLYDGVSGFYTQRGIEFSMLAIGNIVRNVNATYMPAKQKWTLAPVIRMGEYADGNLVENITFHMSNSMTGRKDKIRFDKGSNNTIRNVRLLVDRFDNKDTVFISDFARQTHVKNVKTCLAGEPDRCR